MEKCIQNFNFCDLGGWKDLKPEFNPQSWSTFFRMDVDL